MIKQLLFGGLLQIFIGTVHIAPRALPGLEVVTIKTEGCVLTLGP